MPKVLVMTFKNEEDKNVNVRVNDPKANLTAAQVDAVMDTIIAKNVFSTTGGDLIEKVGAQIVETTSTPLS